MTIILAAVLRFLWLPPKLGALDQTTKAISPSGQELTIRRIAYSSSGGFPEYVTRLLLDSGSAFRAAGTLRVLLCGMGPMRLMRLTSADP
jgi:hypothetical protein